MNYIDDCFLPVMVAVKFGDRFVFATYWWNELVIPDCPNLVFKIFEN